MTKRKTWRCPVCGVDVERDLPGRCPDKRCPPVPPGALANETGTPGSEAACSGDFLSKLRRNISDGDGRVLDDVVNQSAGDGARIEMQLGQDLCDFDAVMQIRGAGRALLSVVRPLAELEGARDEVRIESLEAGITEVQLGKNRF